jgi:hypothetical protein
MPGMETPSGLQFQKPRSPSPDEMGYSHQYMVFWGNGKPFHRKASSACFDLIGIQLISLLYGKAFHIFKPDVPVDHEDYDLKNLMKHHQCFGPFPASYDEIANQERRAILVWVMQNSSPNTMRPFHLTTSREMCNEDKEFVLKVMKLDPRDRPSAQELLEDSWFASGE